MPTVFSDELVVNRSRLAVNVQPFTFHASASNGGALVFAGEDPHWLDYSTLGTFSDLNHCLQRYQVVVGSDEAQNCLELSSPVKAEPEMALTDSRIPIQCLVRELLKQGWSGALRLVRLTKDDIANGERVFDYREFPRKKFYLMCCVDIKGIAPLTTIFRSDQPVAYYKLLLKGNAVEPGLGHKKYMSMLRDAEPQDLPAVADDPPAGDGDTFCALGYESSAPVSKPKPAQDVDEFLFLPPPPEPPETPAASLARSSGDGSGQGVPGDDGAAAQQGEDARHSVPASSSKRRKVGRKFTDALNGGEVVFKDYSGQAGGKQYPNFIFKCPHHADCQRTRGAVGRNIARYGRIEALVFLHAWRDVAVPAGTKHNANDPDPGAVSELLENNRAVFETLLAELEAVAQLTESR